MNLSLWSPAIPFSQFIAVKNLLRQTALLFSGKFKWWRGEDSNLRSLRRQIYSLIPLAAREPLQGISSIQFFKGAGLPVAQWSWREESNPQHPHYK